MATPDPATGLELVDLKALFAADPARARALLAQAWPHYAAAFPDPAERDSEAALATYLADQTDNFTLVLAFRGGALVGGRTFDLLDVDVPGAGPVRAAVGEHLFIAGDLRGGGLGGAILAATNGWMFDEGAALILSEQHDPFIMSAAELALERSAGADPHARARFWQRHGYQLLDAPYIQPGVEGQPPVTSLRLCVKLAEAARLPPALGHDGASISAAAYRALVARWHAGYVADPAADPACRDLARLLAPLDRVALAPLDRTRRHAQPRAGGGMKP